MNFVCVLLSLRVKQYFYTITALFVTVNKCVLQVDSLVKTEHFSREEYTLLRPLLFFFLHTMSHSQGKNTSEALPLRKMVIQAANSLLRGVVRSGRGTTTAAKQPHSAPINNQKRLFSHHTSSQVNEEDIVTNARPQESSKRGRKKTRATTPDDPPDFDIALDSAPPLLVQEQQATQQKQKQQQQQATRPAPPLDLPSTTTAETYVAHLHQNLKNIGLSSLQHCSGNNTNEAIATQLMKHVHGIQHHQPTTTNPVYFHQSPTPSASSLSLPGSPNPSLSFSF